MLSFECDYNTGAHPKILEALVKTNMEPCPGYGNDIYTERAKEKIRAACGREDADVRFLVGGTQTNRIVIDSMLKKYEGVIAATTGHNYSLVPYNSGFGGLFEQIDNSGERLKVRVSEAM